MIFNENVLRNLGDDVAESIQGSASDSEGVIWVSVVCILIGTGDRESGHTRK